MINSVEYFNELTIEFPSLKAEIEKENSEMTHFRMEIFSEYNLMQIKSKNYNELKRCFEFQESRIENLNPNLMNSLNVSYCETLLLGDCANEMSEIRKLMPLQLRKKYDEYEKRYNSLVEIYKKRSHNSG